MKIQRLSLTAMFAVAEQNQAGKGNKLILFVGGATYLCVMYLAMRFITFTKTFIRQQGALCTICKTRLIYRVPFSCAKPYKVLSDIYKYSLEGKRLHLKMKL